MDSPRPGLLLHFDSATARAVQGFFASAAPRIRTNLVNRVGCDLAVRAGETEWRPVSEVTARIPDTASVATFRLAPSGLVGLVVVDAELLAAMVGKILGQPEGVSASGPRGLTRFDHVVARRLAQDVLDGLVQVLPGGGPEPFDFSAASGSAGDRAKDPTEGARRGARGPATAEVLDVGSSARVAVGLPGTAQVTGTTFVVGPPDGAYGGITVAVSSEIARLATPRRQARPESEAAGIDRVLPLPVTLVVELGRVKLSLDQLQGLRPGQVLPLGPPRDAVITAGERPVLAGEIGVRNGLRSVRVKGRLDPAAPRA